MGRFDGISVGGLVGVGVGVAVDQFDRTGVVAADGEKEGELLAVLLEKLVGETKGIMVGALVGAKDGIVVGMLNDKFVGDVGGMCDGEFVGFKVGSAV